MHEGHTHAPRQNMQRYHIPTCTQTGKQTDGRDGKRYALTRLYMLSLPVIMLSGSPPLLVFPQPFSSSIVFSCSLLHPPGVVFFPGFAQCISLLLSSPSSVLICSVLFFFSIDFFINRVLFSSFSCESTVFRFLFYDTLKISFSTFLYLSFIIYFLLFIGLLSLFLHLSCVSLPNKTEPLSLSVPSSHF